MTTKNQEFTFDLQNFANSTTYVTDTTVLTAQNVDGFTGSNQVNIAATGSGNSISVYGGWSLNDTLLTTVATEYENWGTSSQTSISATTTYGHNGDFTYYAFSGSDGSYTIDTLSAHTELPSGVAASNTYTSISSGLPNANYVTFEENTQASGLTLAGGGQHGAVSVQGIGTISDFTEGTQQIALARAGSSSLNLTGVNGIVTLTPADSSGKFNQTFNGATINATLASGDITINAGSNWAAPTLSADTSVDFSKIDTVQTWLVNGAGYNGVNALNTNQITVTGSDNTSTNYLKVNVANGASVNLSASGSSVKDTIGINGVILNGAAKGAASITANTDDSILAVAYTNANSLVAGGAASIGGGISTVAVGGNVTIASGIITAVDGIAGGALWSLGANASVGKLGSDMVSFATVGGVITADSAGTGIAGLGNSIGAVVSLTGDHTLTANGANWAIDAAADSDAVIIGSFDSVGNATITSITGGVATISGSNKTLAIGTHDTMSLAGASQITLDSNGYVSTVNSLAAGSTWLVKDGESRSVAVDGVETLSFANPASSGVFAELTMDSAKGASVSAIDSLSGNVTVGASSISGLEVAGTTWTISGTSDSVASFDSTGKLAAVTAASTLLAVTADATDASVAVSLTGDNTVTGAFNGATVHVHDSDSLVGVQLESGGISGITSLNSGATVTGDNEFDINGNFHVRKKADNVASANTQITLGGANSITVQNVANGDAYTVTGSNGNIVYAINSLAAGGSANVGVNNATVAVTVADADTDGAYIAATASDDVAVVGGIKLNDSVTSSGDKNFSVIYDTSNVSSSSTDTYVMAVNDAKVSLKADNIATVGSAVTMAVDNSDSTMPHVTISTGIANSSTVTVGKGVYNVGNSDAVTVNEAVGYLYVNSVGAVSAEDSMVADIRKERNNAISSVLSGVASPSESTAFYDFNNLYSRFEDHHATVASYANATTTTRASSISPVGVGINIYGETDLSDNPNSVTLQSYVSNSINIEQIEGKTNGATLSNAVIDVRTSTNKLVAVGMNDDSAIENFAVNHTIFGSTSNSTLLVGEKATGNNMVVGNSGNDYIVHRGTGAATINGGSGNDIIEATSNDSVVGGDGADYFYDSNAYEISDYSYSQGDAIIASKLSTSARLTNANVYVEGNRIAIAGGSTLTLGSDYQDDQSTSAIVLNASLSNPTQVIWAGRYESTVDASQLPKNTLIISDNNSVAADNVIGSEYADLAYIGAGDTINSGKGNDTINIASVESNQRGATVVLSSDGNAVHGWVGGFDNESGSNVIAFDAVASPSATAADLNFKIKNNAVVAYTSGSSLNFDSSLSTSDGGGYDFLVGSEKVTFIDSGKTVVVSTESDIADYYKGVSAAGIYVSESVTTALPISLGSDRYINVTKLDLHNESKASVFGSAANESITLAGSADAGANKSVAAGAGNDYILSGGNSSTAAGNELFFGVGGSGNSTINYSTGRDTVDGFGFYRGSANDMAISNADIIYLGNYADGFGVSVKSGEIDFSLSNGQNTVVLNGSFASSENQIVRARFYDNLSTTFNCKFGLTTSNASNNFTYDGEANVFYGNGVRGRDTISVGTNLPTSNVGICLNSAYKTYANNDSNIYYGIHAINAGTLTDSATKATLIGNSSDNIIQAANAGSTSLWGGGGSGNTLIGGAGDDTFIYFKSVGYTDENGGAHGSNDTIQSVQSNDLVWMCDVALADLASVDLANNNTTFAIGINDGSVLTVTNMASDATFRLADLNITAQEVINWKTSQSTSSVSGGSN